MLEQLAPDLFIQRHPLTMLGCQMGRVVYLIRLSSGKLVVHSTANFEPEHLEEIRTLGEPAWLLEATLFHDTCAKLGRAALPGIPYLVPPGFKDLEALKATPIDGAPEEWGDELEVIEIAGMPKIREHALFHRASKTLIVADLVFNLPPDVGKWTQMFLRATGGISKYPGMSRLFRFMIKDKPAFRESIKRIAELDFERLVVAHGNPIEEGAKAQLLNLLGQFDLAPE